MRSTISWSEVSGATVGVWGLGREGLASVDRLHAMGMDPVVVDDRPEGREVRGARVLATADDGLEALTRCDFVVKAPGVSRYRPDVIELEASGIPVLGGLGLWMAGADRSRVTCITGTKGKSTTASIMGHLLRGLGYRAMIGGNLGDPPWDPAFDEDHFDFWVIETSSYQATDIGVSPGVVAVTSLFPDHLDWHGGVDAYYRDKLSLAALPEGHVTVVNGESAEIERWSASLGGAVVRVRRDAMSTEWAAGLGLVGVHNVVNALIARTCIEALGAASAADDKLLSTAARGFVPLASRLQFVAEYDGVEFYDDSLSTNVGPTLAAVDAFPGRRIALIAGGFDRGIDYAPLAAELALRPWPTLVLTLPATGPRIRAAVDLACGYRELLRAIDCADVAEAVEAGFRWAKPGGIVLLSPAAPSFGVFRDYKDRSETFRTALRACAGSSGAEHPWVEDPGGIEGTTDGGLGG